MRNGPRLTALMRFIIGVALVLAPVMAAAEVRWQLTKQQGRPVLQAMSDESESDVQFWMLCRADRAFDVGIGADTGVGNGEGERLTLTLVSAGVTARVAGQSRKSANFQMTAGTELRAKVTREHALFKVLGANKPIAVVGASKPLTLPAKGLKPKLAAFLRACK